MSAWKPRKSKAVTLSVEEQKRLVEIAHQDPSSSTALAARDRLVEASIGLVRTIAYSFAKQSAGYEIDDLIQEGSMSLLDAIRCFNPRKGINFTTYASDCIRRKLAKFLQIGKQKPFQQEPIDPEENPVEKEPQRETSDQIVALRDAIGKLHQIDRAVVEGRMGMAGPVAGWNDLASQLGVPVDVVKMIWARALKTLRRHVPEHGDD